jgi:hypothetical protein
LLSGYVGTRVFATFTSTPTSTVQVTQQTPTPTQPPTPTPATTQQAVVLTQPPTEAPTPTPAAVSSIGAAILGGNLLAFSAKYGPPDSDSKGSADSNTTGHYGYLNHEFDVETQGTQVVSIVANAPANATWNLEGAELICLAFAPRDSVYKQSEDLLDAQGNTTGLQWTYYSVSLGKQLPATDSTDQNGNPVTPGTFTIEFMYYMADTSQVVSCTVS